MLRLVGINKVLLDPSINSIINILKLRKTHSKHFKSCLVTVLNYKKRSALATFKESQGLKIIANQRGILNYTLSDISISNEFQ